MHLRYVSIVMGVIFVVSLFAVAGAQEAKKEVTHKYVGAAGCKMCHTKDGVYESWSKTVHATAWTKLSADDQKKEELKPFYATGVSDKGELLTGIQCEACHGPGSDYKSMAIMKDKEKAVAAGLIIPDAKTCLKCHNEKAPTAALVASAKDFNFEKMKAAGAHAPAKKAEVPVQK